MNNLILLNPETGEQIQPLAEVPAELEPEKAARIQSVFVPHDGDLQQVELIYTDLIAQPLSPQTAKEAGEMRKVIKAIKSRATKLHKSEKAYYLNAGRFVDALKNRFVTRIDLMEDRLEKIENYAYYEQQERVAKLRDTRLTEIMPYLETYPSGIEHMAEDVYQMTLEGAKVAYAARIERAKQEQEQREKEAEEARQALEKARELQKQLDAERAKARALEVVQQKAQQERAKAKQAQIEAEKERERLAKLPQLDRINAWVDSFVLPECFEDHVAVGMIENKFNAFKIWAKNQVY
jgi:DNA repair exonuclease SbcCD ATPase subunit